MLSAAESRSPVMHNRGSAPQPGRDAAPRTTKMSIEADSREIFSAAVSRLMNRLYGAAMRYTRNAGDAEDLLAEVLEKAWRRFDSLEDRDNFDGWMMRILTNTYISQWRRQKTRANLFEDDIDADDLDDAQSLYAKLHQPFLLWYGTPEKRFLDNLMSADIEKALDGVPDAYREVVVMVELLGFTYEEAAQSLEVPVGTVRSRLNRGRRLLQEALWETARDAGLTVS